eukprot:GILK01007766.1.p1 GENE.GILK01007766.1~~GILK01007766.1.p1  ORF type:complete len:710 (-),score=127.71 GILK01007766.1:231-2360(-)
MSSLINTIRRPISAVASAGLSYGARPILRRGIIRALTFDRFSHRPLSTLAATREQRQEERTSSRNVYALLAAAGALAAGAAFANSRAETCGIVAYVGEDSAVSHLLEGLTILQNRGYDSAGVSTVDDAGGLVTTKYASRGSTSDSIDLMKKDADKHKGHKAGIAHTRWATHGGKTDSNAHPHVDYKNRVALVHNGTITNWKEIREELEAKGIQFKSETDSEVIVQLIGSYMDTGMDVIAAFKKTLSRLEGTWGLAVLSKDHPNQILAARNGSPLNIGVGKGKMFVASEVTSFVRHTNEYIALKDGEMAIVRSDGSTLDLSKDGVSPLEFSRVERAHHEEVEVSPEPYPHWTIKEIMEQPEAISRALNYGSRFSLMDKKVKLGGLDANRENLLKIDHLVMAACGTSYHAALYGAQLMRNLKSFETVQVMDAAEMGRESLPSQNAGLLVLSQSGETKDVHRAVLTAEEAGIPRFSIVNAVGSLIARTTGCGVYLNAGRENAVASTKAFTTQVATLAMVASWFSQERNTQEQSRSDVINSLLRLPTFAGICLQTRTACRSVAEKLVNADSLFVLGKGYAESIAKEGALKIKEVSYIHAEGYPGGALKHGPFALIDGDKHTPIIMIILNDQHAKHMVTAAEEVRARGAKTVIITDSPNMVKHVADEVISIPNNGPLTALLATIPLQMIAYELAIARNINPDKPRHLAKAVTVD